MSEFCDLMDCSPPSSSVHRISQARILEWFAISFSRGSSQPKGSNPGLLAWPQILYLLSYEGIPCVCIRCFKPDCQCGSSACIGCQKGLSVLGKQRGTHQKHSQAETTPEGVGRSVVQVCALSHCTASKVENGKRSCL